MCHRNLDDERKKWMISDSILTLRRSPEGCSFEDIMIALLMLDSNVRSSTSLKVDEREEYGLEKA
jgi:hypothetical protein